MSLFAKLAISAVTTTIGGGTAWAVLSKTNVTTPSSTTLLKQQESGLRTGKEILLTSPNHSDGFSQTPQQLDSLKSSQEELAQPQPPTRQASETQNLKGEGNCEVVDGWKKRVIDHLPQGIQYISVFCKNSGDSDSSLTNWRGFFPSGLLAGGTESFNTGMKFDIGVKEEDVQAVSEDDPYVPTNQAVFSSDRFTSPSITGRWGGRIITEIEDEEYPVYEVKLTGSEYVNKFYLQWL